MTDVVPSVRKRDPSAPRPPRQRGTRKQGNGLCACCGEYVGTSRLVDDHCHLCGAARQFICEPCNLVLTEHAERHWTALGSYLDAHACQPTAPALFDMAPTPKERPVTAELHTRQQRLSNGGGDHRHVRVSTVPKYATVEQLAVVLGVNTATARDLLNGRNRTLGTKKDNVYLIRWEEVVELLRSRGQL